MPNARVLAVIAHAPRLSKMWYVLSTRYVRRRWGHGEAVTSEVGRRTRRVTVTPTLRNNLKR